MTREEAINEIKSWDFLEGKEIEAIHTLIPELRETEDERIRKELIEFLDGVWHLGKNANFDKWDKADCTKWIAWLKKQKECIAGGGKTSADEDERIRKWIINLIKEVEYDEDWCVKSVDCNKAVAYLEKQKEQKPAEWSEEDEAAYDAFMCEVVNEKMNPTIEQIKWLRSIRDRLKSLRPQLSDEDIKKIRSEEYTKGFNDAAFGGKAWKPSEEHLNYVNWAYSIAVAENDTKAIEVLGELHDTLLNLM